MTDLIILIIIVAVVFFLVKGTFDGLDDLFR
jgi:hypothetical protein